jgi:hypothetical protein
MQDEAIAQELRTLEINPAFAAAHGLLAILYSRKGVYEKPLKEAERFHSLSGGDLRTRCYLALVYANCGMRARAMSCIEDLEKAAPFHRAGGFAYVYAAVAFNDKYRLFRSIGGVDRLRLYRREGGWSRCCTAIQSVWSRSWASC